MPSNHATDSQDALRSPVSAFSGILRVVLGLIQGLLLYALYYSETEKTWLSTQSPLFIALVMLAGFLPLIAISAIGHLPARKLLIWLGVLTVVLSGLGYYDGWRTDLFQLLPSGVSAGSRNHSPSAALFILTVAGLFIAQAMILAGNADGKRIASYRGYFEIAWKLLVQLLFAALFTGLFWLVLETGNALFSLIKLDFLDALIKKSWFHIPATTLAFSFALHLSDVRPHIVAGIRKLLLSLLSWLLPMATLIVAGFLLSILATGLEPLWQTRRASQVLLGATGLLVVLVNTVYQDGNRLGETEQRGQRFFTLCTRIACLLPTPLVLLAMYSLGLRVAEYGWTVSRIAGAVCALIAALYAFGYGIAAIRLRHNLRQISTTNIAAAFALLLVFLALLSPLADPARIAVLSQVHRLESGKVEPERFDYRFLRFDGDRYGVMQLQRLSEQKEGAHADLIREKANLALHAKNNWQAEQFDGVVTVDLTKNIRMHPADRQLPPQFAKQDWRDAPERWTQPGCLTRPTQQCDAYLVKPDPTGSEQLLIFEEHNNPSLFVPGDAGNWQFAGKLIPTPTCAERLRQAAEQGTLKWQAPLQHDLEIDGLRLRLDTGQQTNVDCAKAGDK
ncbi:DUF4153 domain-containing protein [Herbaspirillum rhizosphaerae]|uniref:DUF4153 domain-containing protein n=1 Tax=Herbaspirillum rhizosphaerae TaxID=346179 RepID=UPI00067C19E0|nr:DUF4153 domain-containing protein [Herbaspirillum rhizosphaerae]